MPKEEIIERARRAEREGKSTSTQAVEFVREEIEAIRQISSERFPFLVTH